MARYQRVSDSLKKYEHLTGAPVYRPKSRCNICSNPVEAQYRECYRCGFGKQDFTPISSIKSFSLYLPQKDWTEDGQVVENLISFSRELQDAKRLDHTEKMSELLKVGIKIATYTSFDLIVIPPSSKDENHMAPKAEIVSDFYDIPFKDVISEIADVGQAKAYNTAEERKEAKLDNYTCSIDTNDSRVIILDDIVSSGATVQGVARALADEGASQIVVVSIARNVDLYAQERAGLIQKL